MCYSATPIVRGQRAKVLGDGSAVPSFFSDHSGHRVELWPDGDGSAVYWCPECSELFIPKATKGGD